MMVDKHTTQTVSRGTALPVSEPDQMRLSREHFHRQFAAVFPGHRTLDRLYDGRADAAVVLKLLGAVVHGDFGVLAPQFDRGRLVWVLKPPPSAYVVDQDCRVVGPAAFDVIQQSLQCIPAD